MSKILLEHNFEKYLSNIFTNSIILDVLIIVNKTAWPGMLK